MFSSAPSGALKLAIVALFAAAPAVAQQAMQVWTPLGFQQLIAAPAATPATLTTGTTLTVPNGARWALICVENMPVRWRDDGVTPTQAGSVGSSGGVGGTGQILTAVTSEMNARCLWYSGALTTQSSLNPPTTPGAIQFTPTVSTGTLGTILDVTYYR